MLQNLPTRVQNVFDLVKIRDLVELPGQPPQISHRRHPEDQGCTPEQYPPIPVNPKLQQSLNQSPFNIGRTVALVGHCRPKDLKNVHTSIVTPRGTIISEGTDE